MINLNLLENIWLASFYYAEFTITMRIKTPLQVSPIIKNDIFNLNLCPLGFLELSKIKKKNFVISTMISSLVNCLFDHCIFNSLKRQHFIQFLQLLVYDNFDDL